MGRARILIALATMAAGTGLGCSGAEEPQGTTSLSAEEPQGTTSLSAEEPQGTTSLSAEAVTVLVIGDWGSGTPEMAELAEEMRTYASQRNVEAILTTGDNFYIDDHRRLMEPYQWATSTGIEFWVTWGNHDIETQTRVDAVNQVFGDPPRWRTLAWDGVGLVILDSSQVGSDEQMRFLETEMERLDAPVIIVTHVPPYNCSGRRDGENVLSSWVPEFDEDVVLMLSGHEHLYQRFDVEGIDYVVTGGGGAALGQVRSCAAGHPGPLAQAEVHHFVAVHQTDDALHVEAIDIDGSPIDAFTIDLDQ